MRKQNNNGNFVEKVVYCYSTSGGNRQISIDNIIKDWNNIINDWLKKHGR